MVRRSGKDKARLIKEQRVGSVADRLAEARRRLGLRALQQLNAPLPPSAPPAPAPAPAPTTTRAPTSSPASAQAREPGPLPTAVPHALAPAPVPSVPSAPSAPTQIPTATPVPAPAPSPGPAAPAIAAPGLNYAPAPSAISASAPVGTVQTAPSAPARASPIAAPASTSSTRDTPKRPSTPNGNSTHPVKKPRVCTSRYLVDKLDPAAQRRLGTHVNAQEWLDAIAEGRGSDKFLVAQVDRRTSDEHEVQLTVRSMDNNGTLDRRSLPLSFQGDLVRPLGAWFDRIVQANGGPGSPDPLCVLLSGWSAAVVKHQDHVYFGRHVLFPGRTCIAWLPRDKANPSIFEFPRKDRRPIVYANDDAAWAAYGGRPSGRGHRTASPSTSVAALVPPPASAPREEPALSSTPFDFDTPPSSERVQRLPLAHTQPPPSPLPAGRSTSRFPPSTELLQAPSASSGAAVDPNAAMVFVPMRESLLSGLVRPLGTNPDMGQFALDTRMYTPFNNLKRSSRVDLIGVVESSGEITRAASGTMDYNITIQVRDNSAATTPVSVQIWRKRHDMLKRPQSGDVIIVLGALIKCNTKASDLMLQATLYSESKRQGPMSNLWAILSVSADGQLAWCRSDTALVLSDQEKAYAMRLALWGRNALSEDSNGNAHLAHIRQSVTLDKVRQDQFYNVTVEVIGILESGRPRLLATDYCANQHFEKRNDLALHSYLHGSDPPPASLQTVPDGVGGGRVVEISLYQGALYLLHTEIVGKIVYFSNARCRASNLPMLELTVGNQDLMDNERGRGDGQVLNSSAESFQLLQERKRQYIKQLNEEALNPSDLARLPRSPSAPSASQSKPCPSNDLAVTKPPSRPLSCGLASQAMQRTQHSSPSSGQISMSQAAASGSNTHPSPAQKDQGNSTATPVHTALASAASFRNAAVGPRKSRPVAESKPSVRAESTGVLENIEGAGLDEFFSSQPG